MKEENNIKKLFKNLEGNFDVDMPNTGHENRFLEKLKQQNNVANTYNKKTNYWKPFLAVAASIVLCFSVFALMQQQDNEAQILEQQKD